MDIAQQILPSVIAFATCTFLIFALILWLRREDNRSRIYFAVAFAVCGMDLFLRIVFPSTLSFEAIHPGYICLALGEIPLFLLYIVEVINPGWLTRRRIGMLFIPLFCWIGLWLAPGLHFREMDSYQDVFQYIGEFNVWVRVLFVLLVLPYSFLIYYVPYNWRRSSADVWLIRLYGAGFIVMGLFFVSSSLSGSVMGSCLHLIYGMSYCFYLGYYELFVRLNVPHDEVGEAAIECVAEHEEAVEAAVPQQGMVAEDKNHLWKSLCEYMSKEESWRNPVITLVALADRLQTNRTTLSAEIHAHGFAHLRDFIACYRIRAICRMIDCDQMDNLEDAFFEVGYRSRSTAYDNFKKQTGMTPGQYMSMKREETKNTLKNNK